MTKMQAQNRQNYKDINDYMKGSKEKPTAAYKCNKRKESTRKEGEKYMLA